MAWQRFKVELKGEEPQEVQTNALDMAQLVMDPQNPRPVDMTFRLVHHALLRQGASVPRDYASFLEILDGVPEPCEEQEPLDPTANRPSDGPP